MKLRFIRYSAVLGVMCGTLGAQDAVQTDRTAAIQGIVVGGASGTALDGIEVWLETPERPTRDPLRPAERPPEEFPYGTLTSSDGRFLLENIPPGEYRLFADGSGVLQQEYGQRTSEMRGEVLSLRAGETLNVDFVMRRTATISGHVRDEAGAPVEGIPVYAKILQYRGGNRVMLEWRQARLGSARRMPSVSPEAGYAVTDGEGAYQLTGLPPGDYRVVVQQRGREEAEGFGPIGEREPFAPIYYPNTARVEDAVPVHVGELDVFGVGIEWRAVPLVAVQGQFEGFDPDPSATLRLSVATPDGVPVSALSAGPRVDPDGSFRLLLPPYQSYVLSGVRVPRGRLGASGTARVDVGDEALNDVRIVFQPPARFRGRVLVSPGAEPPDLSRLSVHFERGLDADFVNAGSISTVRSDGTFEIRQMPGRDRYRLSLEGLPDGYYLESAILGAIDLLTDDVSTDVPPEAVFTIRLGSAAGEVSGTVVDQRGEVRTGAKVTLVPVGVYQDRYDRFIAIHTDDDGRFRLEGVPAGPYMIYAWESIPVDAERNREFLALYRGRGQSLQIEQGGTVEVELRTIE